MNTVRTVRELPPGYQETCFLRVTDRSKMIWLNILAIVFMMISASVFYALLLLYSKAGAPFVIQRLPQSLSLTVGITLVLGMIPVHEWVHGLAMQYYGHPVRYGIKPLKGVVYATSDGAYFWRRQFIIVALAPLVVISLIGLFLAAIFPVGAALWILFMAAMNAAGAAGDLWMVWVLRKIPPGALVRDEQDGMRVFSPI